MSDPGETPTLFTVWNTPIKVKPIVLANLFAPWGFLAWLAGRRRRGRPWPLRLLIGFLSTLSLLAADLGHAVAHVVSARYAGAPMDEIIISEGMPRTLYYDSEVQPHVHRLRAMGGPIFSTVGLVLSLVFRTLTPRGSMARQLADWSCLGHGFILGGSLIPLPFVDGGTIVKWTLVERGWAPEKADTFVRQVDLSLGVAATTTGLAVAATRRGMPPQRHWLPALGLAAVGAIAFAAALDKIR